MGGAWSSELLLLMAALVAALVLAFTVILLRYALLTKNLHLNARYLISTTAVMLILFLASIFVEDMYDSIASSPMPHAATVISIFSRIYLLTAASYPTFLCIQLLIGTKFYATYEKRALFRYIGIALIVTQMVFVLSVMLVELFTNYFELPLLISVYDFSSWALVVCALFVITVIPVGCMLLKRNRTLRMNLKNRSGSLSRFQVKENIIMSRALATSSPFMLVMLGIELIINWKRPIGLNLIRTAPSEILTCVVSFLMFAGIVLSVGKIRNTILKMWGIDAAPSKRTRISATSNSDDLHFTALQNYWDSYYNNNTSTAAP